MHRHLGPREADIPAMLRVIGGDKYATLESLVDATVPAGIRLPAELDLPDALTETEALAALKAIAVKNVPMKSFIGMGYYDCITPGVIQRNILENPGEWGRQRQWEICVEAATPRFKSARMKL